MKTRTIRSGPLNKLLILNILAKAKDSSFIIELFI